MKNISVQTAAAEAGLTYNTFREHLNGRNGELAIRELDAVGPVVGVTAGEIVLIAEGAQPFPLRREHKLTVLPGGRSTTDHGVPARSPLLSVVG